MKRIKRDAVTFDAFQLFVRFSEQQKSSIEDPETMPKLLEAIPGPTQKLLKNAAFVYGHRTEAMFEMVVGSLGKVALLRGEDAGDIFYATDAELAVPDFRVALHDTSQLLIEVKNHYQKKPHEPHVEKTEYLEKLTAYAALTKCELLIATYWTRWNTWTLVPVDAFSREGSRLLAGAKIRGIPATIFGEEVRRQNPAKPDGEERADRQRAPRRPQAPAARFRFARVAALFAARSLASLSR